MPVPDFIAALRAKVGHDELWLTTADAVIVQSGRVLLVLHGAHQEWMFPGGHVEPGEHPADACARETLEETGVTVVPERLIAVTVSGLITYPGGDQARHLELAFACRIVSGEPRVADSENAQVAWSPVGSLPDGASIQVRKVMRYLAEGTDGVLSAAV